jgi:hypothetical protein
MTRGRGAGLRVFCFGLLFISTGSLLLALPNKKPKPPKEAKDSVTVRADAVALVGVSKNDIKLEDQMNWPKLYEAWKLNSVGSGLSCLKNSLDKNQAYVFHLAQWAAGNPPRLVSSSWSAYGRARKADILKRRLASNGDPLIYGKRQILLIGLNVFDVKGGAGSLSIRYKSSITQAKPENVEALGQLVSALAGLSAAKAAEGSVLIAISCLQGTAHLPFDLNVVETIGVPKPANTEQQQPNANETPVTQGSPAGKNEADSSRASQAPLLEILRPVSYVSSDTESESNEGLSEIFDQQQPTVGNPAGGSPEKDSNAKPEAQKPTPSGGQADCSSLSAKNDCTISRTLTSLDKEWWDVSLAVPTPGVKESRYSISGSMLQSKSTTHTDLYALFDIYPWARWVTKDSGIPHFTVGLPVAGQTFYRPEFGIAENFTGWTTLQRKGFPTAMSIFVGMTYMKTTIVDGIPTTAAQLSASSSKTRVWKPVFGLEVPVNSLISKVGKGSKSKNTNSGSTGGGNGNQGTSAQ